MDNLLSQIKNHYQLSPEAQCALSDCFKQAIVYKNDQLIKEGSICRKLFFLEIGALRGFYNVDGKEITHWFGFENDFVTSFHSFITGEPAVENIQMIENGVVWWMWKNELTALFDAYHEIERLVRIVYEKYYIRLEERYVNAQFKTARERYDGLLQRSPHILERVPLGFVASYLGISQETLSRIRARL